MTQDLSKSTPAPSQPSMRSGAVFATNRTWQAVTRRSQLDHAPLHLR